MEPSARSVAGGLLNCRNISTVPGKKKERRRPGGAFQGTHALERVRFSALQQSQGPMCQGTPAAAVC
jgi:hypothetical protein